MYQSWTQLGDAMTILTPDKDFSTNLMFLTPALNSLLNPRTEFAKLSVVTLTESMKNIYLNGESVEVGKLMTS